MRLSTNMLSRVRLEVDVRSLSNSSRKSSCGFSLVEIMVGIVIGMLAVIVIMQVFSLSEGRKRTTTSGSDSMTEGAIAMYALQRDLRQAGNGVAAMSLFGCDITFLHGASVPLAPVVINPAEEVIPLGDPDTDTLLIFYAQTTGQTQGQTRTVVLNDKTYYIQDSPCKLATATPMTLTNGQTPLSLSSSDALFVLGTTLLPPRAVAYAIRAGNLTVCDYMANDCGVACTATDGTCSANWISIASNIVSLRAQYGRASDPALDVSPVPDPMTDDMTGKRVPNYIVSAPDDASPYNQTTPTVPCGWARTGVVRLALVARSGLYEKEVVTATAPVWDGSAVVPIDLTKKPDGSAWADDGWKYFRYRVFQTTIPLMNVTWMGQQQVCQTGCVGC